MRLYMASLYTKAQLVREWKHTLSAYLKDALLNEDCQQEGVEAVDEVCPAPIFGRKEVLPFLDHEPFRKRPLPLWLDRV